MQQQSDKQEDNGIDSHSKSGRVAERHKGTRAQGHKDKRHKYG
jgi:hypothetical protein